MSDPVQNQIPKPSGKNSALYKLLFIGKFALIGFLMLLLMIPMAMIQSLISERDQTRNDADWEVVRTWGRDQTLGGPVLTVPYKVYIPVDKKKVTVEIHYAHFLPETLKVSGHLNPEIRYRGIYEVLLYGVNLKVEGNFLRPDFSAWHVPEQDVIWGDAFLSVGIPDMRAIQDSVKVHWGDKPLMFGPGSGGHGVFPSGIQAPVPDLGSSQTATTLPFSFDLALAGSKQLNFLPFGKQTEVALQSEWNNPSFTGAYLPQAREVNDKGFDATWKVLHLGRNYPQQWLDNEVTPETINESSFGVNLIFPVDTYQQATRSAKYAILFILLTFVTFFFFEIFNKIRIHPVQYLLVGFALCMFYLLLISLSEHISFARSYLAASAAIVLLISIYSAKVLKNKKRALVMGTALSGIYGYLYILLQLQDYALLMGALGLFLVLGLIMFITRKVDWYSLGSPAEEKSLAPELA